MVSGIIIMGARKLLKLALFEILRVSFKILKVYTKRRQSSNKTQLSLSKVGAPFYLFVNKTRSNDVLWIVFVIF